MLDASISLLERVGHRWTLCCRETKRETEKGGVTRGKMEANETKRGRRTVKTDTEKDIERMLKSRTEIGLAVENRQGVRSHREWEKNLGCHISVLQNACSPQMFASNINSMPNKPLCSSLQLQLPLHNAETGSVCLSILQESVPDNIKKPRTGLRHIKLTIMD